MKEGAAAAELLAMREEIERTVRGIEQIKQNLDSERRRVQRVVGEYNKRRILLFFEGLRARGMTWCTCCSQVLPEGEAKLILLEGREEYSGGDENSCYGFRDFRGLHHACPACCEKAFDKHGSRGLYDTSTQDQSSFFAFHVEKCDDGYYVCKFGEQVKIDDGDCKLPKLPSQLIERLAGELNLPPRIEFDPWQDELRVYKSVTVVGTI